MSEETKGGGSSYDQSQSSQSQSQSQSYDASQSYAYQQPYGGYEAQQPYGAYPPQQPYGGYQSQPYAAPAQPAAPQPLEKLSGGMKFGWLLVGLLSGIPGILVAWLANVDRAPEVKSGAIKYAVIGLVIAIVVVILGGVLVTSAISNMMYGFFDMSFSA